MGIGNSSVLLSPSVNSDARTGIRSRRSRLCKVFQTGCHPWLSRKLMCTDLGLGKTTSAYWVKERSGRKEGRDGSTWLREESSWLETSVIQEQEYMCYGKDWFDIQGICSGTWWLAVPVKERWRRQISLCSPIPLHTLEKAICCSNGFTESAFIKSLSSNTIVKRGPQNWTGRARVLCHYLWGTDEITE